MPRKPESPPPAESRLLVEVVSNDPDAREAISQAVCSRGEMRVLTSVDLEHVEEALHRRRPDAIVAHARTRDECLLFQSFADRNAGVLTILIVTDIEAPGETASDPNVDQVREIDGAALAETLPALLEGLSRSRDAPRTPREEANRLDQERLALLSEREREVLALTAEGLSMKEIAQRLHRAYATVASHRNNIMEKLQMNDRVALTRFAIRVGLAEP
ncbi:MAG: response regulator transcription factor [Planctomycetota bacterium]|nr:response regulator transcription factor [Planctomycetota bacterium]